MAPGSKPERSAGATYAATRSAVLKLPPPLFAIDTPVGIVMVWVAAPWVTSTISRTADFTYGVDDSLESTGMANKPAVTFGVTWDGKLTISVRAEWVHHGVEVAPPLILSPAVCEALHGPQTEPHQFLAALVSPASVFCRPKLVLPEMLFSCRSGWTVADVPPQVGSCSSTSTPIWQAVRVFPLRFASNGSLHLMPVAIPGEDDPSIRLPCMSVLSCDPPRVSMP